MSIIEKACNDVNDKIMIATGGVANNVEKLIESNGFKIFGYEISMTVLFIMIVCLIVVLYFIYSYFFKTDYKAVSVKKYKKQKDNDTEDTNNEEDDDEDEEEDNNDEDDK
jgi:hypothetical protein